MHWEEIFQNYIVKFSDDIRSVTRPLKDLLGIPFFGYHRIDLEGQYITLTDRPDWAEHYLEHKFYLDDPYLKHPDHYSEGVRFFCANDSKTTHSMFKAWKKKMQADEGVVLIEKKPTSVEFFIFAGHYQSKEFSKVYLNHLPLLKTFSNHFKSKLQVIITKQQKEGYLLPLTQKRAEQDLIQPKLDNWKKELFIVSLSQEKILKEFLALTPREKDCLKLIHDGYSTKEIAYALTLSPRTVEYYVENIKNKIDCHCKQDLISKTKLFYSLDLF